MFDEVHCVYGLVYDLLHIHLNHYVPLLKAPFSCQNEPLLQLVPRELTPYLYLDFAHFQQLI